MGPRTPGSVVELDVLRGLAIVMMVLNHAGNEWLSPQSAQSGPLAPLVFVGSFAPVVFFFATGFGVALSTGARATPAPFLSVLWKATLLLLADQMLFWKSGTWWGLDFLGFIALSTLMVTAISKARRPLVASALLLIVLIFLRYGLGPLIRPHLAQPGPVAWVVGAHAVENVSYPLTSWLVYPLLGFIVAHYHQPILTASRRWPYIAGALGIGLAFLVGALVMHLAGSVFFRWGVVSAGYFVLSIGVVFVSSALAMLATSRWPSLAGALSMRGIASLAVVPVHYALLDASATVMERQLDTTTTLAAMAALIVASMMISTLFAKRVSALAARRRAIGMAGALAAFLAVSIACLLWATPAGWIASLACMLGQLAIAAMLALRNRSKAVHAPVPTAALS